jgi:hypothetical protein
MTESGWIGVDLDGTLAEYHGWNGGVIGSPVPLMITRVKKWISDGVTVKVFTARACTNDAEQISLIKAWCVQHIGQELEVTAVKDFSMIELWDDRAVQVVANTGVRVGHYATN